MPTELRDFLEIPYAQLEEMNLEAKSQRVNRVAPDKIQEERLKYLTDEKRIKAVTVCFANLEGRLHMLDYDKKFLLKSADNLTFDGSSIRGFTAQRESDLRLGIDWRAFYWLPADVFGPGKVLVFGEVLERDGSPYSADIRGRLKAYLQSIYDKDGLTLNAANEIEGFLLAGKDAEQNYANTGGFEFVTTGGYYNSLPGDPLRLFIDKVAEVQRSMGFANEKDHPEVAPAQFEINYGHSEGGIAADQIELYKLICRQVAHQLNLTASFLPKPVTGVNGSGMHTNMSISKNGTNTFYDPNGQDGLSANGWNYIERILAAGLDTCLIMNSSVNAFRRLDPHYEAPNQIMASPIDRGSMVRIPIGNEKSARVEMRSIAPDANPYLALYTLVKTGLEGPLPVKKSSRIVTLPDNIYDAIDDFSGSKYITSLLGKDLQEKYAELKLMAAHRSPRLLGTQIKASEIIYHHEVTNQYLWSQF